MRSNLPVYHPTSAVRPPALPSPAEQYGVAALRLAGCAAALALIVTGAMAAFDALTGGVPAGRNAHAGWRVAAGAAPAFAVSHDNSSAETATYEVLAHPEGGRKDILRWAASGPAELELYRPGAEAARARPPVADVAGRMDPGSAREMVGEGVIDSKFGPVALLGFADRAHDSARCLGFTRTLDAANLRISGWSCQGDGLTARRAAIACTLDRLELLPAANEPALQQAFAGAEEQQQHAGCASGSTVADWVSGAQTPALRGSL